MERRSFLRSPRATLAVCYDSRRKRSSGEGRQAQIFKLCEGGRYEVSECHSNAFLGGGITEGIWRGREESGREREAERTHFPFYNPSTRVR